MPSEIADSIEEVKENVDNTSIKAINLYELNDSVSEE